MRSPARTSPPSPPQAGEVSGAGGLHIQSEKDDERREPAGGGCRGGRPWDLDLTDRGGGRPRIPSFLPSAPQETGSAFVSSPPAILACNAMVLTIKRFLLSFVSVFAVRCDRQRGHREKAADLVSSRRTVPLGAPHGTSHSHRGPAPAARVHFVLFLVGRTEDNGAARAALPWDRLRTALAGQQPRGPGLQPDAPTPPEAARCLPGTEVFSFYF